jgi:hypothetical protein
MRTRIVLGLCITLLLVGALSAADFRFTGAVDELWSNPDNWREAALPGPEDKAQFVNGSSCLLDIDAGEINNLAIEAGTTNLTLVDGAHPHTLNVLGGTLDCQMRMYVGFQGYGKLVIDNSGVVNLYNQQLGIGQESDGNGRVELKGGSLNLLSSSGTPLLFRAGANSSASMDFSGGVMTQAYSDARLAVINNHIADGTITAYGSQDNVVVETIDDMLIVKGLHPLNPVPADSDIITPGNITLSWTVDAGTQVDVWFTTKANPDEWTEIEDKIVYKQAVTSLDVTTDAKQRYFWAVDTYAPGADVPELGPVFDFYAGNVAPVVYAGDDVTTWLENGSVDVALAGDVTDVDPTTTVWTVVSEPDDPDSPDAVIADAAALNTSITLSAPGEYVLQLEADDGEFTGSDTMTISVYSDSCEAAKSLPDYVPLDGDVNADCLVDFRDFALIAVNWLESNAL